MKKPLIKQIERWALTLCLLFPLQHAAAQFVELTAEIEINDWDYWFFADNINKWPGYDSPPTIFIKSQTRRCVVGTNTWMIEAASDYAKVMRWFTGTNIIEHTLITKATPEAKIKKFSEISKLAMTSPRVGEQYTRVYASVDGNPGRPGGVADLMGFDLPATVCWQAFCSGPFLKREGRHIFPPSAFWKESSIVYSGWSDQTVVFNDSLGLPKSINLVTTNSQSIFQ